MLLPTVAIVLLCAGGQPSLGGVGGEVAVPRGRRTVRPRPTHLVVRPVELEAQGAVLRVAAGVPVVLAGAGRPGTAVPLAGGAVAASAGTGGAVPAPVGGRVAVTLLGVVAVTGRLDGATLGLAVARPVEVRAADGTTVIGRAREGALVTVVGKVAGLVLCETVGPVRARVALPADALDAEAHALVYPVVEERLRAVVAETDLAAEAPGRPRARLAPGARVAVVDAGAAARAGAGAGGAVRVRTYGAFELEGLVPRERLGALDGAPPLDEAPPGGLTPTHEALADASVFADAGGRRPVGFLRGGTLAAVGIETAGPRVRVMTVGPVVGELWVTAAELRPLERELWNDRP